MKKSKKEAKKVAKLVTFSLTVRVVVDEKTPDEGIIEQCYKKVQEKLKYRELGDNCVEIEDDTEVPFGEGYLDLYFQPEFDKNGNVGGHPDVSIPSFLVWRNKEILKRRFPNCTILEYSGEDIKEPSFAD
jgi:hypothetical protein